MALLFSRWLVASAVLSEDIRQNKTAKNVLVLKLPGGPALGCTTGSVCYMIKGVC